MSILSLGLNEKTKTPEAVVGQPEAGEGKRIELSREKFQQRGFVDAHVLFNVS